MPTTSKRALRTISALAKRHGFTLQDSKLAGRKIGISCLYAGGSSLSRLINNESELHFAQCGSRGVWMAVIPASVLMHLLETENLYNQFRTKFQKAASDE
jgi:hypothetical protein